MADHSLIEWTDASWNPITGCSVVSPGCTHCYAMRLAGTRLQHHPSRQGLTAPSKAGPVWNGQVRLNEAWLDQPLRWRRPRRIFVCAHGDLFHEAVPDDWIDRVFAVMALSPQHTFQVLTKRPERMRAYFKALQPAFEDRMWATGLLEFSNAMNWPLPNVWLGVSVEDQRRADERIPILLDTPAAVRWISAEPLLGPVDISRWTATANVTCKGCGRAFDLHAADPCRHQAAGAWTLACPHCGGCVCRPGWSPPDDRAPPMAPPEDWPRREVGRFTRVHPTIPLHSGLDWVVVGGESGPAARPMHPDWARQVRDQSAQAGVPFFFKQWGDYKPAQPVYWQDDPVASEAFVRETYGQDEKFEDWDLSAADAVDFMKEFPDLGVLYRDGFFYDGIEFQPAPGTEAGCWWLERVGKKAAGRLLDGQLHDAMPEARS